MLSTDEGICHWISNIPKVVYKGNSSMSRLLSCFFEAIDLACMCIIYSNRKYYLSFWIINVSNDERIQWWKMKEHNDKRMMIERMLTFSPWRQTRDFSSRYCSSPAPTILPFGSNVNWTNFPKRLELLFNAVLAFPNASSIGLSCIATQWHQKWISEPPLYSRPPSFFIPAQDILW